MGILAHSYIPSNELSLPTPSVMHVLRAFPGFYNTTQSRLSCRMSMAQIVGYLLASIYSLCHSLLRRAASLCP